MSITIKDNFLNPKQTKEGKVIKLFSNPEQKQKPKPKPKGYWKRKNGMNKPRP